MNDEITRILLPSNTMDDEVPRVLKPSNIFMMRWHFYKIETDNFES